MANPIESAVKRLRKAAETGTWDGTGETPYFRHCRIYDSVRGWSILFTRDVGYHSSGWWKNPDYERCYHLSLAFRDPETRNPRPRDAKVTAQLVDGLFGRSKRFIWTEPPYSPEGKRNDVWHYRLFCDAGWNPIKPRGEVYGRELIEAGWMSWSDAQAALEIERKAVAEILGNR